MSKSILIAGMLGGLLGGIASFAAGRIIKPAEPPKSPTELAIREAQEVADAFVAKLKALKFEEFILDARAGGSFPETEIAAFKSRLLDSRTVYKGLLGSSTSEFEQLRATALSPSLVRFVYLERFEKGAVWWTFVFYHGKDNWKLVWADHGANLGSLFANLS